jgi:hypothetical protein
MVGFYEHGDKLLDSQKQKHMTMNYLRKSWYNGQIDNFIHSCSVFYYMYQVTHVCMHLNTCTHTRLILIRTICKLYEVRGLKTNASALPEYFYNQ